MSQQLAKTCLMRYYLNIVVSNIAVARSNGQFIYGIATFSL